nr:MAG TPA: meiotic recombination protein [Caudoviricetes sp.]
MTNKDYERLTYRPYRNDEVRCLQPDGELQDLAERLYKLENAIENGTLVFLPCKVDDKFWWFYPRYDGSFTVASDEVQAIELTERGITIIDTDGARWFLSEIYFTKEAAKKALEEMKRC